jgi:hypothetical protein
MKVLERIADLGSFWILWLDDMKKKGVSRAVFQKVCLMICGI